MSQPAIEVKDLSKVYRIGHERKGMKGTATLRDSLTEMARKPLGLITGRQLKKEEFWALKDINFEIQQGDVVGIIGKNGSGKSTLLKILSQIVEPTSGEIKMRGKVASLLEVGTGFHPELTGRENIFFNGAILGMKRKEILAKFDEIVDFSEVEQFLDTPVKFYSSGMYVRLAFAIAAHLEPDILIVDEVLAVGDAAFQKKSLGKMKDVASEGRTVLFVSHSLNLVQSLCNKALLLKSGKILGFGETKTVARQYFEADSTDVGKVNFKLDINKPLQLMAASLIVNEKNTNKIEFQDDITFNLKLSNKVSGVRIDINIFSWEGARLACFSKSSKQIEGQLISATVPARNLAPGNYYINISVLSPEDQLIDFVAEALYFTVLPTEVVVEGSSDCIYGELVIRNG